MHTHYLFQQRNNKVKPTKRKVLNWLRARARETLKVAHRWETTHSHSSTHRSGPKSTRHCCSWGWGWGWVGYIRWSSRSQVEGQPPASQRRHSSSLGDRRVQGRTVGKSTILICFTKRERLSTGTQRQPFLTAKEIWNSWSLADLAEATWQGSNLAASDNPPLRDSSLSSSMIWVKGKSHKICELSGIKSNSLHCVTTDDSDSWGNGLHRAWRRGHLS
jgi:hypothetical protein